MRLGISEILLLLAIGLLLFGPAIIPRIQRWYRRAGVRQQRVARRHENVRRQVRAARDELLHRFSVATGILIIGGGICWLLYLIFAPCAFVPQSYTANRYTMQLPEASGQMQTLDIAPYENPVCVVLQDGWLYAAVDGGKVIRIHPDGTGLAEVLSTDGAVTGLCFAADGSLYLTDAAPGGTLAGGSALLKASFDGWAVSVEPVVTTVAGCRLACLSGLSIAQDGKIYFTDFSQVPAARDGLTAALQMELLAHSVSGSLYVYDPETGETACVAKNIAGAGGVAADENGSLYFSETESGRVWKLPCESRDADISAASATLVLDGLPGYPAGLSADAEGKIFVALCGNRLKWLDNAAGSTLLRRIVMHLPKITRTGLLMPKAEQGRAVAFAADGTLYGAVGAETDGGRITGSCAGENGYWLANADGTALYFTKGI